MDASGQRGAKRPRGATTNLSAGNLLTGGLKFASLIPLLCLLLLVVADVKCDKIGSTNELVREQVSSVETNRGKRAAEATTQRAYFKQASSSINSAMSKLDPLAMLREIYLDHNSKIVTVLAPGEGDQDFQETNPWSSLVLQPKRSTSVQKFHPNGRYGRRSVDSPAGEPHSELGTLVYREQSLSSEPLRKLLHSIGRDILSPQSKQASNALASLANAPPTGPRYSMESADEASLSSNGPQVANMELEMNKLLRCNYTGMTNLYWCYSSASSGAIN